MERQQRVTSGPATHRSSVNSVKAPSFIATTPGIERYPCDDPRGGAQESSTDRLNDDDFGMEKDENKCERCGRTFKGRRGVKIHQGKKKRCGSLSEACSKTSVLRETMGDQGQDSNHSVQDTHAEEGTTPDSRHGTDGNDQRERLPRLLLPKSSSAEWKHLDEDLDKALDANLRGPVLIKIERLPTLVYAMCKDRFGVMDRSHDKLTTSGPSRRQQEISELRSRLRILKKQYKRANEMERPGLAILREEIRGRLKTLRNAERLRKKRANKRRAMSNFYKDPFKYVGEILTKPKSGKLICSREELDASIKGAHEDPLQNTPLGVPPDIREVPPPTNPFDMRDITLNEVEEVIKKARSKSAPGPSGLTYKIFKKCPRLTVRFWKLLKIIWRKKDIPQAWQISDGCFVPKEENSTTLEQFREISLLSIEGNILGSDRTTAFELLDKE